MQFECTQCERKFKAQPIREEYNDPVFGSCWRDYAICPTCGAKSKQYSKPKPQVRNPKPAFENCGSSGVCCGGMCGMQ